MEEDAELRLKQLEIAFIKVNHFTETFPVLMETKLEAISNTTKLNRNLILIVLAGLVTGVLGLVFMVLRIVQSMP